MLQDVASLYKKAIEEFSRLFPCPFSLSCCFIAVINVCIIHLFWAGTLTLYSIFIGLTLAVVKC